MSQTDEERYNYFFSLKPTDGTVKSHSSRSAENQCQYMLPTLKRMVEAKHDLKLLDVGCGPGSITISLAKYLPWGKAVGVDVSEVVLEKARAAASDEGVHNVEFRPADVYQLPFEDETFDVINTHQAVAHFHDHVRAIKEMLRVLRPGGILCMREGDLYTIRFWPDSPLLDECFDKIRTMHASKGGAADAGRHLKAWTVQAGIPRENILATAGTWCYHTPQQRRDFDGARLFKGASGEKAVEAGILTRDRIQEYEEAWRRWTEDDDALLMMMHGEVMAMK
jgi:SAM-dependent methyltransferase